MADVNCKHNCIIKESLTITVRKIRAWERDEPLFITVVPMLLKLLPFSNNDKPLSRVSTGSSTNPTIEAPGKTRK